MLRQCIPGLIVAVIWTVPAVSEPLEEGYAAAVRGDDETAFRLWRPLAWTGLAEAQFLICQDFHPEASDKLAGVASWALLHAHRSRAVFSRGAAKSMKARTLGATSRA